MSSKDDVCSVKVANCSVYPVEEAEKNFQIDVRDQRESSGNIYIDVGAVEGEVDDFLGIAVEVGQVDGEDVPCVHVNYPGFGDVAFTVYKFGENLIIRPSDGCGSFIPTKFEFLPNHQEDAFLLS